MNSEGSLIQFLAIFNFHLYKTMINNTLSIYATFFESSSHNSLELTLLYAQKSIFFIIKP
jgi:hypothetical protein